MKDIRKHLKDMKKMGSKGNVGTNGMNFLIGALIIVVLATSLGPTMFSSIADFNTTDTGGSTPVWVPTVLYVIVGAGLIFLIWRAFGNK